MARTRLEAPGILSAAPVVPQRPALGVLGRPPRLADVHGHLVGEPLVAGVEVDVVRDQEFAGAHGRGAPARHEGAQARSRAPIRPSRAWLPGPRIRPSEGRRGSSCSGLVAAAS